MHPLKLKMHPFRNVPFDCINFIVQLDPPYNTGSDAFVYDDDFAESAEEFAENSGAVDEDGNRLFDIRVNNESNGRFHTDWLNMMYPRLRLAKDLLSDDGVIFISIDDNEQENLKKICDEIFGAGNFVANIVWQKKYAATNDSRNFSTTHDYISIYAKSVLNLSCNLLPRTEEQNEPYKHDNGDGKGLWRSDNLLVKTFSPSGVYPIVNPNTGKEYFPPEGSCWRASKNTMKKWLSENRIFFGKDGNGAPQLKRYLNEVKQGRVPVTWWGFEEAGHNDSANKELRALFARKPPFDTPKPVSLINRLAKIGSNNESIILDFFSGSATTAHAIMQLNAEDGGHRKFILVQLPEATADKSEAKKVGYNTICDIGEERIRRAGKKIKEETGKDIDYGFRVFTVDSSNMKDVYYSPQALKQEQISLYADNIKEDRIPEDLLFQVMLDLGVFLSSPIEEKEIGRGKDVASCDCPDTSPSMGVAGKKVFSVDGGYLIACFDTNVTEEVVTAIAKEKPFYAVFRDSSMANDSVMTNFEQIFETYSPNTVRKVL